MLPRTMSTSIRFRTRAPVEPRVVLARPTETLDTALAFIATTAATGIIGGLAYDVLKARMLDAMARLGAARRVDRATIVRQIEARLLRELKRERRKRTPSLREIRLHAQELARQIVNDIDRRA